MFNISDDTKKLLIARLKSFGWRLGVYIVLAVLGFVGEQLKLFSVPPAVLMVVALILNEVTKFVSDHVADYGKTFGAVRSNEWSTLRAAYLKKQPNCESCGGNKKVTVHHIHPFHLFPQYELCETLPDGTRNYITLCEGNKELNCHLILGHADNFRTKWNPNVPVDASIMLKRLTAKNEDDAFPKV